MAVVFAVGDRVTNGDVEGEVIAVTDCYVSVRWDGGNCESFRKITTSATGGNT